MIGSVVETRPAIHDDVVRLESVRLDQPSEVYARLYEILSDDERARANRFVFDRDRRRFVVCRGTLRQALASFLECEPTRVALTYSNYGKPSLHDSDLEFNVSHSAGVALFAFAIGAQVGVDVEAVDRQVDIDGLAARFFSPDEADDLLTLPPQDRQGAFFDCWTRKESYIKAIGDGMSRALDSFSVTKSRRND